MVDLHSRVTELERTETARLKRIDNSLRKISYQGGIPLNGRVEVCDDAGVIVYRDRKTGEERHYLVVD